MAKATWRQKLERAHENHGKIVPIPEQMQIRLGAGGMLIPRPLDVDAIIRKVRKGKLMTQSQLRVALARQSNADATCPMTTGIFVRIVAEAAEEDRREGKKRITPYWRIIKDNGALNDKFPGGPQAQAKNLRAEGFTIKAAKGKQPPKVIDFERILIKL